MVAFSEKALQQRELSSCPLLGFFLFFSLYSPFGLPVFALDLPAAQKIALTSTVFHQSLQKTLEE